MGLSISPIRSIAAAVLVGFLAAGASADDVKPIAVAKLDRATPVDFEKELLPALKASCMACHNKTKAKADLVLETPADILKGGDAGPAVVPGKPQESILLQSAAHSSEDVSPMPPPGNKVNAPNLTSEQLGLLSLWIQQGAKGEVKGPAPIAWRQVSASVRPVYAVAVSPDGALAAAGRGTGIDLYDLKENKLVTRLGDPALEPAGDRPVAHRDLVQSLAFSPDGKTLASGAYREVKLWQRGDSESGGWKLGKSVGDGGPQSPIVDRAVSLDFSPDGKLLAIGGGEPSRGGQIALYSVEGDKVEKSLDEVHSDTVLALQFSADGKRLVTGSADKFVRLVEVETGKVLRSFEGHTHHVLGVALKKDGKVIASAGADNTLRFWDAETGERKKNAPPFEKEATAVRFVGDTDQVIACTGDAKVELFKDNGSRAKTFSGPEDFMYAAAASTDGKTIIAGGQDGVLRVWSADGKSVATFE